MAKFKCEKCCQVLILDKHTMIIVDGKIVIIDTRTKSRKVANKLHEACEYQAKFYSNYNAASMLN